MPLLKTLLFTLIAPGTMMVYLPHVILREWPSDPHALGPLRYLGLLPMALGAAFYLWCAWDFATFGSGTPAPIDPPKRLIARGLYRHVRNPMYVGVVSAILGEALFFANGALVLFAASALLGFHAFVVLYEERALARQFGEEYARYRRAVPRWVPRIAPYRVDARSG